MPIFAALFQAVSAAWVSLWVGFQAARISMRLSFVAAVAAIYVACVIGWTLFMSPLALALFSTQWGQFLGLAFPPISGSVIAGFVGVWICIVSKNYLIKVSKAGIL